MEMTAVNDHNEGPLFDWKLDVERLEREARAALHTKQPNDWALVEAECSQDLIAAELRAVLARKERSDVTARTVEHLKAWEMRLGRAIRQLRSVTP